MNTVDRDHTSAAEISSQKMRLRIKVLRRGLKSAVHYIIALSQNYKPVYSTKKG